MKILSERCVGPDYEPLREFIGTFFGRWKMGQQNWNDSPVDPQEVGVALTILLDWAEKRTKKVAIGCSSLHVRLRTSECYTIMTYRL